MKIRFWPSLAALLLVSGLGAQDLRAWYPEGPTASFGFPENDEVRRQLRELIFAPVGSQARMLPPAGRILSQRGAVHKVMVRLERQQGFVYTLFLNERPPAGGGTLQPGDRFPVAGAGAYIIKRDMKDGRYVQAKIYLRDDPGCFVRLFPDGGRTMLEGFLFGVPVARRVSVPLAFEAALVEPFARIMQLTRATVHWDRFFAAGESESDQRARKVSHELRAHLGRLGDREDGALDAAGRFVFIDSGLPQDGPGGLNCSGFAKWVTDGFVYPLTGAYLDIEPLKEKPLALRGHSWSRRFEDQRDPYFGLDWSRNLAVSLLQAAGYPVAGPESSDVRIREYARYTEDVGYPVEELELVLYLDSMRTPGGFYLGSLNREYGSAPVLRQHFHLIVLLPYFSETGRFEVAVFDRGRETSLEEVRRRFAGDFIHLVRLPVTGSFQPPAPAAGQ